MASDFSIATLEAQKLGAILSYILQKHDFHLRHLYLTRQQACCLKTKQNLDQTYKIPKSLLPLPPCFDRLPNDVLNQNMGEKQESGRHEICEAGIHRRSKIKNLLESSEGKRQDGSCTWGLVSKPDQNRRGSPRKNELPHFYLPPSKKST